MLCVATGAHGAPKNVPEKKDDTASVSITPVDENLLIRMFSARLYLDDDGTPDRMTIIPTSPSMFGMTNADPLYDFFVRWRELYDSHLALLQDEDDYAEEFHRVERQLIQELGYYSTQRDGRTRAYALFRSRGLFARIVHRAGKSELLTIPPEANDDPWGSNTRPYARGIAREDLEIVRESVLPFRFCAGIREKNGHGITISGGNASKFVRAHETLMRANAQYRQRFKRTISPFVDRGKRLDPMDFAGASKLTHDIREALVASGIADAIEQATNSSNSAAASTQSQATTAE